MKELNRDYKRRAEILGIPPDFGAGGIHQVENLPLADLETLFAENFIDPEDAQNEAPTAQAFLEFMRGHPETLAHGYAVSPNRDDYRVTIEGLRVPSKYATRQMLVDFVNFCKEADELYLEYDLYSWWD